MTKNIWRSFIADSKSYDIFSRISRHLIVSDNWPNLAAYNADCPVQNYNNKPIRFIKSDMKSHGFDKRYEPRIYLTGEVQTRSENWHDYFNMLVWKTFPNIKSALNAMQFLALSKREGVTTNRSSLENLLTLFDEGGIVVCSSDNQLLTAIKSMSWKELFWNNRERLSQKLRCFTIGHATHEKCLQPYIGMVAHGVLLQVNDDFLKGDLTSQLKEVDSRVADYLLGLSENASPKLLFPIPVLGFPGWYKENHCEIFYDNSKYFRSNRML